MSELCFWHDVELESQGEYYHCPECGTFFKRINGCLENVTTTSEALWCWNDQQRITRGMATRFVPGCKRKRPPLSFWRNWGDE